MAIVLFGACHSQSGKQTASSGEDSSIVKVNVPVSDTLAAHMAVFLHAYYTLKEAFVRSDTTAADEAALHLKEVADSLQLGELKNDTVRYHEALAAVSGLGAEIAGLLGEKTALGKRQEFQMISGITYKLIKTTGLKGQTVYRDFCPMFNDGNGAYWLSDSRPISNPYYGTDMPDCGELRETITF